MSIIELQYHHVLEQQVDQSQPKNRWGRELAEVEDQVLLSRQCAKTYLYLHRERHKDHTVRHTSGNKGLTSYWLVRMGTIEEKSNDESSSTRPGQLQCRCSKSRHTRSHPSWRAGGCTQQEKIESATSDGSNRPKIHLRLSQMEMGWQSPSRMGERDRLRAGLLGGPWAVKSI